MKATTPYTGALIVSNKNMNAVLQKNKILQITKLYHKHCEVAQQ